MKNNIFKRFLDSQGAWDFIQGPVYNRLAIKAASELYRNFVDEVKPGDNAIILDVGCGPGYAAFLLAQENPTVSVIAIDYSPTQVRTAKQLQKRNRIQNCSFRLGDAMNLPFEDSSFNVVISVASIKHWPDVNRGLKEILRVLVPNGNALIAEANKGASEEELNRLSNKFTAWYVNDRFMKWYLNRIVFGQSYTPEQVESLAISTGFRDILVQRVEGWPFFIIKLKK